MADESHYRAKCSALPWQVYRDATLLGASSDLEVAKRLVRTIGNCEVRSKDKRVRFLDVSAADVEAVMVEVT